MTDRLSAADLDDLATGAGILGTGGGGDPRLGRLRLEAVLRDDDHPNAVDVVDPTDLPEDATVTAVGGIGAPTVSSEKPPAGGEELKSLRAIEQRADETVDAVLPGEIGGANSMVPFVVGALADLPVVDADGMGRAFPELQMCTFFIYGISPTHAAITDERGNQVVFHDIDSAKRLEDLARSATVEFGGHAGFAFPLLTGKQVRDTAIPNTVSAALEIGDAVATAGDRGTDPVTAVCEVTGGHELFAGKVVDVHRRIREGFAVGSLELESLSGSDHLEIEFQNEFLIARSAGETVATVPDLITIVDKETAAPIPTGRVHYGQRVRVLVLPAPDLLRTERAIEVIGPGAFGYDAPYQPIA